MIHFLIDGWSKHICQDLIWSCYEIGLRLGTPFLIDSVGAEIAADQVVVGYRGPAAVGGVESNRYLSLPVALSDPVEEMPCGHREVSGRSLWIPRETSEPDVISGVLHLLRFFHESQIGDHERDDLSRIPPTRHPLAQAGFFIEPLLDNNVEYLRARLSQWGMDIPPPCPWGKRGEYAVCLTHDVDGPRLHTLFALARSAIYALRGDRFERESAELGLLSWLMRRPDPYWNFAHWQSLEHGLGIASTYFFTRDASRVSGAIPGIRAMRLARRRLPEYFWNLEAAVAKLAYITLSTVIRWLLISRPKKSSKNARQVRCLAAGGTTGRSIGKTPSRAGGVCSKRVSATMPACHPWPSACAREPFSPPRPPGIGKRSTTATVLRCSPPP